MKKHINLLLASSLVCGALAAAPALAAEDAPTAEVAVDALSEYVWRGYSFSQDSIVLQPSMTVAWKGFGVNLWGNLDTDEDPAINTDASSSDFNEIDLTLSYDGSYGKIGYGVGYIYYGLEGAQDSQEVYLSLSYDTLLSPTLTYYNEITGIQGWYLNFSVSHALALTDKVGLELGASVGYLDDENGYDAWHDGTVSVALPVTVNEYVTVTPKLAYTFALSSEAETNIQGGSLDNDDTHFYGGVGVSFAF